MATDLLFFSHFSAKIFLTYYIVETERSYYHARLYKITAGRKRSVSQKSGALNAAAWAISICYGRPIDDLGGDYDACHAMVREVADTFRNEYGGILCKDVMIHTMGDVYDWKTPEGDQGYMDHNGTHHCATAVAFCAEIIARMIVEGKLKHEA